MPEKTGKGYTFMPLERTSCEHADGGEGLFTGTGAWWVIVQAILFLGFFLVPTWSASLRAHPADGAVTTLRTAGGLLMIAGFIMFAAGIIAQGRRLTPLPVPREGTRLIERGAYRLVRHPIYGGMLFTVAGWTVFQVSISHAVASVVLTVFFDRKARFEERALTEKLPLYDDYRRSVRRRFVPFLY